MGIRIFDYTINFIDECHRVIFQVAFQILKVLGFGQFLMLFFKKQTDNATYSRFNASYN
jgi:hypothetical protein